jgi:hypothetical protein
MVARANNFLPVDCASYNRSDIPGCIAHDLSARSWKQIVRSMGEEEVTLQLNEMIARYPLSSLLPTWNEWQQQLETAKRFTGLHAYQLHISFSNPVMYPGRLALSSLLKLYDSNNKQSVRIKISCFTDPQRQLWWEVGFVYAGKSVEKENGSLHSSKDSYFLLSELVANTHSFLSQRNFINGIHLSPAYYHVLPLSKRIASQYSHHIIEPLCGKWESELNAAYTNYCKQHDQLVKTSSQKKFIISQLLQRRQLFFNNELLKWNPPLIAILR